MKTKATLKTLWDDCLTKENQTLNYDEDAIFAAYQKGNNKQSLAIKILSIFGGIVACLAFLGFLVLAGLYDSPNGLIVFGCISIVGAVLLNKFADETITDTISVTAYIIGFALIGVGLSSLRANENTLCALYVGIAFATILILQNYILSFVAILIVNGSILALFFINRCEQFIPIYVAVLSGAMAFVLLKEAKLITFDKALNRLYNPLKVALIFSFLAGLVLMDFNVSTSAYGYPKILLSGINISLIIYLVTQLFGLLNFERTSQKAIVYLFIILALTPTVQSPAITGTLLIMLLSFWVNYKTGLAIGIIAFIYFITRYYYDLNFSLLTKSIILLLSGIIFLLLYLLAHRKLTKP